MATKTNFSDRDVVSALLQLSKVSKELQDNVADTAAPKPPSLSDDKTVETTDAILSAFVTSQMNSDEKLKLLTNFTLDEFCFLADLLDDSIRIDMFSGRGRKCSDTPHGLISMRLVVLKHGGKWIFLQQCLKCMYQRSRKL